MQDCYTSMCLTAPEVAQYEDGIQTLQTEITSRKDTAKEKEDEISSEGIPLFDQLLVSPSFGLKMDTFGRPFSQKNVNHHGILHTMRTSGGYSTYSIDAGFLRCA